MLRFGIFVVYGIAVSVPALVLQAQDRSDAGARKPEPVPVCVLLTPAGRLGTGRGELVKGLLTGQTAEAVHLQCRPETGGTNLETLVLTNSWIARISRMEDGDWEFGNLPSLELPPDGSRGDVSFYLDALGRFRAYARKYPNDFVPEIQRAIREWETERALVAQGKIRVRQEWFSPAAHVRRLPELAADAVFDGFFVLSLIS